MMSFARVLIDYLHKTSEIGFVLYRVFFRASVLFNIPMSEKLWKLAVWLELFHGTVEATLLEISDIPVLLILGE
jgi:hypothetical protein